MRIPLLLGGKEVLKMFVAKRKTAFLCNKHIVYA